MYCVGRTNHRCYSLAFETCSLLCKHHLIGKTRYHPEAVDTGYICTANYKLNTGIVFNPDRGIANSEIGTMKGASNNPQEQCVSRYSVGTKFIGAQHLGFTIKAFQFRTDRLTNIGHFWFRLQCIIHIDHRINNFPIPGTTTKYTTKCFFHLLTIRRGVMPQ